jgi:nitroreductase
MGDDHLTNHEEEPPAITVVADAVSIYAGGKLTAVGISELLNNEVAVRQLINDYNQTKRENHQLHDQIQRLTVERAGLALQPAILGANAVFGIVGALLVGLGTNFITGERPPSGSWLLLFLGALISLVSAILPIGLPLLIARHSKGH